MYDEGKQATPSLFVGLFFCFSALFCVLLRQVFGIITSNFADVDPGLLASLHDTPWTMIKLAHTARKQGLTEVCLNSLSKLYSVATMDVQVRVQ